MSPKKGKKSKEEDLQLTANTLSPKRGRKGKDEDFVTLSQVREMLEQQRLFYKEMLVQQEQNFKSFLTIVMDTNNKRLDGMGREISELRESLHYTQKDVDELLAKEKTTTTRLSEVDSDLSVVAKNISSFLPKLDYLDIQVRKNNIMIDGIPESEKENGAESEEKVRQIFAEKLKLSGMEFERIHRTGNSNGDRVRPIVARFVSYKDKVRVMECAKNLKGTNVYINEDYPEEVRQKRKELIPAMKAARERGEIAFLRYDKLIIHPAAKPEKKGAGKGHPVKSGGLPGGIEEAV